MTTTTTIDKAEVTLTDEQIDDCDRLIRELGAVDALWELLADLNQTALTLTALDRMNTDEWRKAQPASGRTIMDRAIQVREKEMDINIAQSARIQKGLTFEECGRLASRLV
jgi:hypothetical protein